MKPADGERIMADLGLSDPLAIQYVRWLADIGAGRLGKSFFRVQEFAPFRPVLTSSWSDVPCRFFFAEGAS